jgi:hypothetical protein
MLNNVTTPPRRPLPKKGVTESVMPRRAQPLAICQLANQLPGKRPGAETQAASAISPRIVFITLGVVRVVRGCDAESVLKSVGDATHPKFLRWVFDISPVAGRKARELRFWKEEIWGNVDKWAAPGIIIPQILGPRQSFPRGEIEVQWIINSSTISRLVRAGELTEGPRRTGQHRELTRASLAAFLERRLQ